MRRQRHIRRRLSYSPSQGLPATDAEPNIHQGVATDLDSNRALLDVRRKKKSVIG